MNWINKILALSSSKKIECKRYFDESHKTIDLPSMVTNASVLNVSAEASMKLGQIKTDSEICVPENISERLVMLDINQYNIARAINSLPRKKKAEKIEEYIDMLFEMYKLVAKVGDENYNETTINTSSMDNKLQSKDNLKKYLDDRHFKSTALPDDLNVNQGYVIWPVALLAKTTYIHKAQAQLIKLLTNCGWRLLVIIGDCGKNAARRDQIGFTSGIEQILRTQNIPFDANTIAKISEYYQQEDASSRSKNLLEGITGTKILSSFHSISEGLKWSEFDKLIKKNYDETKKEEIKQRNVLHNIQPLLIWSLVATIVKDSCSKAIVIAGEDEQEQWDYVTNNHTNNNLGVIYIHELKKDGNKTMNQEDLLIRNTQEMRNKLQVGNMAEWLYTHFVELPKFTTKEKPAFCRMSDDYCRQYHDNCINCLFGSGQHFQDEHFNKDGFVNTIYPLSNPAN